VPLLWNLSQDLLQAEGTLSRHSETGPSDQSRPAHRSPKATPSEVVNKILYLRQQYRTGAGPIADWSRRQRWQRYEKPQPGHRLQVDVKCLERIPDSRRRLYQFTAIDDCTRIGVYVVQTDNGAGSNHGFNGTWRRETCTTSTSAHARRI
jgi:hypothetical protein